jgi:hypothetical protein
MSVGPFDTGDSALEGFRKLSNAGAIEPAGMELLLSFDEALARVRKFGGSGEAQSAVLDAKSAQRSEGCVIA